MRFTDYHASPMCTPTRGSLMTGLDPARNGAINVSSGRTLLRANLPTMADLLREQGYRTGIFGKWHLGDNYPYRPQDRGFEETLWFPSSHIGSVPDHWGNNYFDDTYRWNGKRKKFTGYCTDIFFDYAIDWIKRSAAAGEPFFAYLPTNTPHGPFLAPDDTVHMGLSFVAKAMRDTVVFFTTAQEAKDGTGVRRLLSALRLASLPTVIFPLSIKMNPFSILYSTRFNNTRFDTRVRVNQNKSLFNT